MLGAALTTNFSYPERMITMKSKSVLACLLLMSVFVTGTRLRAQTRLVSLTDYLNVALQKNPLLRAAERGKASAVYSSESVRKGYLPQIGIASHLIVAPGYDQAVTNGGEVGAQIVGLYTLYDGGARSYEIQKGGVGVEQGSLNINRTKADIVYSVSTAYAAAVKEKRELNVVELSYAQLKDYLQFVKQLHAAGQGSETDVVKTTVDLNNAAIDINARKVAFVNSLLALAQASGLPSADVTDVDSTVVSAPFDTTFYADRNIDLASQRLLLKQAELDAQIAGSRMRPTISLGADAGALTSLPNLQQGLTNVFGASLGVSLSLPFFTFGSLQNSYNAAMAGANSISLQNDYARTSLAHDFHITRNAVERAKAEIAALQDNLVVAEQNLLLSKARYAGGSGLSLEVLDAIQMVNQIKLAIEEARSQMAMSIFKLNRLNYSGVVQE
jgi:outer membrane protein